MTTSNGPSALDKVQADHADHAAEAPMTLARFRVLADAYGAAPARWPAAERAAAERLLAGTGDVSAQAQAREALAEALALDALLSRDVVPAVTAQEMQQVLARFTPARRPWRWAPLSGWHRMRVAAMAALMACAGGAGIASGAVLTAVWFPANAATVSALDERGAQGAGDSLFRGTAFGTPETDWSEQ